MEIPIKEDWKAAMYDEKTWDQKFITSSLEILKGGTKGARLKGDFEKQSIVNIFLASICLMERDVLGPRKVSHNVL
jgi:hypothetical protein